MSKVYKKSIFFLNTGSIGDMSVKKQKFHAEVCRNISDEEYREKVRSKTYFSGDRIFLEKQFSESTFLHISSDMKSKLNTIFNTPF